MTHNPGGNRESRRLRETGIRNHKYGRNSKPTCRQADLRRPQWQLRTHFKVSLGCPSIHRLIVIKLCSSIDEQVAGINEKKEHGKGRQILESTQDKADVVERYRRIESLFRQLLVSARTFTSDDESKQVLERHQSPNLGRYQPTSRGGHQT